MRDAGIKRITWTQIDVVKGVMTVGTSKTTAGAGRTIPIGENIQAVMERHRERYVKKLCETRPDWYVFPFGRPRLSDPTRPVTTLTLRGVTYERRRKLDTVAAKKKKPSATVVETVETLARSGMTHFRRVLAG
jgi:hypothetical protein